MHVIKKRLTTGVRWYVYAWRGGPCIAQKDGARPVIDDEMLGLAVKARWQGSSPDTLAGQIVAYKAIEFPKLRQSTRGEYNRHLAIIQKHFGDALLSAFNDSRMRKEIIDMRDSMAETPRKADGFTAMFSTLLAFCNDRALVQVNVASGISKLHKVNLADVVWLQADFYAVEAVASKELWKAVLLARYTGLRLGDLISLKWEHVGQDAIIFETSKRGRRVAIPMIPELRKLLTERSGEYVLQSSYARQWTADGLKTAFQRAKHASKVTVRFHDLRGTYATSVADRMTDQEIARVMGWSPERIGQIRARYVDEARVIIELSRRLSA